eukprot:CAMPEP_0175916826 /NCGR_PEP_ID=MMETSP0108-20121206/11047_1 /TAXON_ID=195067 ORGANISM="Goniomonas pacifica, Strain CCMP1869" /NCGR_SAMPLE_ID=MMETSP0108 /ASSEMBLY_ACC=CAM_ASM_000204 /LENGTH=484 /DNA_ID=CAMNT_0017239391 /DNA_START=27 /DNA_END=1481 /DNA_ORIENTATION=-
MMPMMMPYMDAGMMMAPGYHMSSGVQQQGAGDPNSYRKAERALKIEWDPESKGWKHSNTRVQVATGSFAKGGTRLVYKMKEVGSDGKASSDVLVAKFLDKSFPPGGPMGPITREMYFEDAMMQQVCIQFSQQFNATDPPKKITFLPTWIIELIDRPGKPLCCVEPFLKGSYAKHNNNDGATYSHRHTPQSFSHFTYEKSGHKLLVCDIQGVGDLYTDPQIHTTRKLTACKGNKGAEGIDRFLKSHRCNTVCFALELPPLDKAQVTADVATVAAATPRSAQLSPRSTPRSIPVSRVENSPRLPDSSPKPPLPPGARSLLARVDALLAIAATNPSPDSSMLSSARTPSPSRASRGGPTTDLPSPLTLGGPARDDLFKQHERTLSSSPVLKSRPRSASLHDNFFSLEHPVSSSSSSSDLPPVPRSYSITPPVPSHTTPTEDRPRSASVGRSPADGGDEFARLRLLIRSTDQTVFAARTAMYSNSKVI